MFENLWSKIRGVLQRMGLVREIKELSSYKKLNISDEHYQDVQIWKELYSGYHGKIHDYYSESISDGRKKKRRLTLNMPKIATAELASLIFNEKCQVNIGAENAVVSDLIKETLKLNNFNTEFQRFLEYCYALGGICIKVYLKDDDKIGLNFVNADNFIPISWDNGGISEGVFVDEQIRGDFKYTHLEWHEWQGSNYVVSHELFRTARNSKDVGMRVSLSELYPDLDEKVVIGQLSKPLFVYIKPNSANNIDLSSPLGMSIFHNSYDVLRAIDIAYDSFEREFRLGRKRIVVPSSAIRQVVGRDGEFYRYFDATDETYEAFYTGEETSVQDIKDISVSLRVEEHVSAINALLNLFSMQIGFSPGAFSFNASGEMKTATEVVSMNSKTFRTKQAHETIVETALIDLVDIIVQFAQLYDFIGTVGEYETTVTFDDSIAQDRNQDAQYFISLVSAGLLSKIRAIQSVLGVSEEDARAVLDEIDSENQSVSAESVDMFGLSDGEE